MTEPIAVWPRPKYQPTDQRASIVLIVFVEKGFAEHHDVSVSAPPGAEEALDVRYHEDADWLAGFRTGPLRNLAARSLPDLARLDAATACYSVSIQVPDPPDLSHLQLGWAVAGALARRGALAVLDTATHGWHEAAQVAALPPHRPFRIHDEVKVIAEDPATAGFGHVVHTRGMIKFARPDLLTGVTNDRIEHTGRVLNHLSRMLAEGMVLVPHRRLRFDDDHTFEVVPYEPDGNAPEVHLNNDGLLLVDA